MAPLAMVAAGTWNSDALMAFLVISICANSNELRACRGRGGHGVLIIVGRQINLQVILKVLGHSKINFSKFSEKFCDAVYTTLQNASL